MTATEVGLLTVIVALISLGVGSWWGSRGHVSEMMCAARHQRTDQMLDVIQSGVVDIKKEITIVFNRVDDHGERISHLEGIGRAGGK